MNNLKVIMNKGADILNDHTSTDEMRNTHYKDKNDAINHIIEFRQNYYTLDKKFRDEIDLNIKACTNYFKVILPSLSRS
jgi:hypothetical protein